MNTRAEKTQDYESQAVANSVLQVKNARKKASVLVDNRSKDKTNIFTNNAEISQFKTYNKSVKLNPLDNGGYSNINEIKTRGSDPKSQARDLKDTMSTLFGTNMDFTGAHMIPQRLNGSGDDSNCRPWPSGFENNWNTGFDSAASNAQTALINKEDQSRVNHTKLNPIDFSYSVNTDDASQGDSYQMLLGKGYANSGTEKERSLLQIHSARLDAVPRAVSGKYKTVESNGTTINHEFAKSSAPWDQLGIDDRSGLTKWWTSMKLKLGIIPSTPYDELQPNLSIDQEVSEEARNHLGAHVHDNLEYRATGGKNRHVDEPPKNK